MTKVSKFVDDKSGTGWRMVETITPERLQELIDMHLCYSDIMSTANDYLRSEYADLLSALQELQSLRSQNKELIEDAESLATILENEYYGEDHLPGAIAQHNALMQEIGEQKV